MIEKLIKKIPRRYWNRIEETWLRLPDLPSIEPPGRAPFEWDEDTSSVLDGFLEEVKKNQNGKPSFNNEWPISGIRPKIFHLGIRWMHKSIHALSAAELKISKGYLSWSTIDAYAAAYFGMRSVSAFLGLDVVDRKGKSIVIDLCKNFGNTRRENREQKSAFEDNPALLSLGVRFDHIQHWEILRRLMRILSDPPWNEEINGRISKLKPKEITHQRNRISYDANFWIKDDLFTSRIDHSYANDAIFDKLPNLKTDLDSFTMNFAYTMARLSLILFSKVAGRARILHEESKRISETMTSERHPYFAESLSEILINLKTPV